MVIACGDVLIGWIVMPGSRLLLSTSCQRQRQQHRKLLSFVASLHTILEYNESLVRTIVYTARTSWQTCATRCITANVLQTSSVDAQCDKLATELSQAKLEMWANAQRDGRPAEYRWRPLFNAAVWLTPTTRVPCSNAAKT